MIDKNVSAGQVAAWGLWAISIVLWAVAWWAGDQVGRLSILVAGMAITAHIRCYFVDQHRRLRSIMAVRSAVEHHGVRTLH